MLPDFVDVRSEVSSFLSRFLQSRVSAHSGIFGQVKNVVLHECKGFEQQRFDGSVDRQPLKKISGKIVLDKRRLEEEGLNAVLDAFDAAARDMGEKQRRFSFRRVDEILTDADRSFAAEGGVSTPDALLDALDKTDIEFDAHGRPQFPTIVCGRALFEEAKKWHLTCQHKERLNDIVQRKYREWRDRESDRRLAD